MLSELISDDAEFDLLELEELEDEDMLDSLERLLF